jgi:hypothetical protein
MAELEPAADASWVTLGEPRRRDRWVVELREGQLPAIVRGFRSRRRAERYARRHACEHQTATIVPYAVCSAGHKTSPRNPYPG